MKEKKHTTRIWLAIGTAALAGTCLGELAAYDGFAVPDPYPARKPLNELNGGTGFAGPWAVDTSESSSNARRYLASKDAPTYTDTKGKELQTQPGTMQAKSRGSGKGALMRDLEKEMTGTLWISFLTQMDEQVGYGWDIQFRDAAGEMQFKVMNGRKEQNRWRIQSLKTDSGKAKDGLFKNKKGMTPVDATLIILKVENAGSEEGDSSVTAYLNPTDLRDAELSAAASIKISGLTLNAIKQFSFDKKSAAEGYIDELRFGTTIEDVIPLKKAAE